MNKPTESSMQFAPAWDAARRIWALANDGFDVGDEVEVKRLALYVMGLMEEHMPTGAGFFGDGGSA